MALSNADIAAELCRQFPRASTRVLAKRLCNEHPALFPNYNTASCSVRYARGNRGDALRKEGRQRASTFKANGPLPPLPESIDESWTPFEIDCRRCPILGDIHLQFQSDHAVAAALRWCDTFNPDAILINGDLFDFYQLSRFEKKPTIPGVSAELLAGGKFFDHLHARFPKARLFYKLGNHDERWERYIFNAAPLLADVEGITDGWHVPAGIIRNKVTVIRNKRPVMLGELPVLHGHELPMRSSINPARAAFLKTKHTIAFHHFHKSSGDSPSNMFHDEMHSWSFGCLCGLSPPFMPINEWNHGFGAVTVERDGSFDVQNLRIAKNGTVRNS